MLLSEAIDYVSYFMDIKKADGAFAEAWSIIFKKLVEGQKPSTNTRRDETVRCVCEDCKHWVRGIECMIGVSYLICEKAHGITRS